LTISRGDGCPIFCPQKKRLVLRHQQRWYEFYTSRKRTILKEPQQVAMAGFNIPSRPQKCLHDHRQTSLQRRGRLSAWSKPWHRFVTGRKLIMLNVLPKGSKFHQIYFIDYFFPDLKTENVNFHHWIPQATIGYIWTIQCATMDQL
jgi:hypothetical protein